MYHHRCWGQSDADVLRKGEEIPVLRGCLGKERGHELILPKHAYVRLWGLYADHKLWPPPKRQGRKPLEPRLGGRVAPGLKEGEDSR